MSDLKIKNFKEFAIERLTEFEISPNSMYAAKLALAYEEMSQEFKTAEYRLNCKVKELQSRITALEKALEVSRKGLGTISLLLAEGRSLYTPEERRWIARNTEKQIEEILKQVREK